MNGTIHSERDAVITCPPHDPDDRVLASVRGHVAQPFRCVELLHQCRVGGLRDGARITSPPPFTYLVHGSLQHYRDQMRSDRL